MKLSPTGPTHLNSPKLFSKRFSLIMLFEETKITGLLLAQLQPIVDDRGFFARSYCETTFRNLGLNTSWPQCNLSHNEHSNTLRGLHFQAPPKAEIKWVRIATGSAFIAVVDLRPNSPTFKLTDTFILNAAKPSSLYIPGGLAYGFQTLEPNTDVFYQMSTDYYPELAGGIRWDDPDLNIAWPLNDPLLSERDQSLPSLSEFLKNQKSQPAWTTHPIIK